MVTRDVLKVPKLHSPTARAILRTFKTSLVPINHEMHSRSYDFLYLYRGRRAQHICTWGWGWGFQRTTEQEVPLHQTKKNQILSLVTGQENRLSKEKIKRQRNQNQNLTSKARRESEIDQQSCD